MRVTYNWLKDFVDIKISARELADKLTMAGLEVVSLEEKEGDFIFEIEITSNRPDWLSVLGIAREVAMITGAKLKNFCALLNTEGKSKTKKTKTNGKLKIEIEDKKDCPLYTARIIENVKVGSSPEWIKKRLELVGCRNVNNVVDITNYVLFELGEPLHAFDLGKINQEKIVVRRAKAGEKILTIDGLENNLSKDVLLIADADKAVAIAGVMGGKDSEVSFATKNILLEAAVFNPVVIRRSRQAIGKTSEASYRFERGIDLDLVNRASLRAAQLLKEFCAAQETSFTISNLSSSKETQIDLDIVYVAKTLGINLAAVKIKQILTGLGFQIKQKSKNVLRVKVPSFRQDVKQQIDLVEEISRIFGYERIPNTVPSVKPVVAAYGKRDLVSEIKNMLIGLGVTEAITYSLIDRGGLVEAGLDFGVKPVEVMNPLSQEQEILRPTLMLGLGRAISFNLNQKQEHVAIFEIADIFKAEKEPEENLALGIALSGTKAFFTGQGKCRDEASLLNLKGILETIFVRLGIADYEFIRQSDSSICIYIQKEKIGLMFELSAQALNSLEIKNRNVFLCEVSLEKLLSFARPNKKFVCLPKYPGITRDISFILQDKFSVRDILILLKEKGQPLLSEVRVADYYQGKQIPTGFRGLTLSCLYASGERTLTEKEIQPIHDLLCQLLNQQFQVKLR
ncbi:MAG: phenylalanine--tRNA ligase subunit beta [Candidatus Omnitrophica bacterium]|nr:phenylalanine--tRNA ligase subunit beta [Candidatus Omnitrophota bacterium]